MGRAGKRQRSPCPARAAVVNPAVVRGRQSNLLRETRRRSRNRDGGWRDPWERGGESAEGIVGRSGRRPEPQGGASRTQDSRNDKRPKNQLQMVLAFSEEGRRAAPRTARAGTESLTAKSESESPAREAQRMEEVCGRENGQQALRRVKANKGSPGIEGRRVEELPGSRQQHGPALGEQRWSGTYPQQAGRRVEIKKPEGGATQMGRDVLRAPSRVSSATLGAAGGDQGAAVYRRRQPLGGGPGLREVLRAGQPRPAEGGPSAAGERQEDGQADASLPGVRREGERAGESGGGRNSARRALVSAAVEPGAR